MATTLPILDSTGSKVGDADLDASWLEREKGDRAVRDSVVSFLARMRAGTASTKVRSEVRGGGAKPYRQKGTGRARAGSIRSPIWRGGGVIFGPAPRSFAKKTNRKVRLLALRRALTERIDENAVIMVDEIALEEAKTRHMVAFLKAIEAGHDALIVVDRLDPNVCLAARNLPGVEMMNVSSVNTYWMLLFKKIVITRAALEALGSRIAASREKAE